MNWFSWALLSSIFAALTAFFTKLGVKDVDSFFAAAVRTSVAFLITWGVALGCSTGSLKDVDAKTYVFLVLSGMATGLSWLCYFRAMQFGDLSKVAVADKLSVLFAVILGVTILGESVSVKQGFGLCMLLAGAVLMLDT